MPFISALTIHGFRGFSESRTFRPAVPDGVTPGSGLTVLIGPNNAGKSSITEALVAVTQNSPPSFHVGQRNAGSKFGVRLELQAVGGTKRVLTSVGAGAAPSQFEGNIPGLNVYCIPSRRQFASAFGQGSHSRENYTQAIQHQAARQQTVPLHARLQFIATRPAEKRKFDGTLAELMGYRADWTIDQHETGQYFLKYTIGEHSHSSDGLGDGIVGLFSIAAALYEPLDGTVLIIDEPELSLHPQFQRRVLRKFVACSANCQVVVATHSPLFISWPAIANGAEVVRVLRDNVGIHLHPLSKQSRGSIKSFLADQNNPHVLGLDANEIFFYEDGVIMVEGQEDVVLLPSVAEQVGLTIRHPLFGWGVGGADKMEIIAALLRDLGFKRVVGILDRDKADVQETLRVDFPDFSFFLLPADDVRTKPERTTLAKSGVLDDDRRICAELTNPIIRLLDRVNRRLDPS